MQADAPTEDSMEAEVVKAVKEPASGSLKRKHMDHRIQNSDRGEGLLKFKGFGPVSKEEREEQRRTRREREAREAPIKEALRLQSEQKALDQKRERDRDRQRVYRSRKHEVEIASGIRMPDGRPKPKVHLILGLSVLSPGLSKDCFY